MVKNCIFNPASHQGWCGRLALASSQTPLQLLTTPHSVGWGEKMGWVSSWFEIKDMRLLTSSCDRQQRLHLGKINLLSIKIGSVLRSNKTNIGSIMYIKATHFLPPLPGLTSPSFTLTSKSFTFPAHPWTVQDRWGTWGWSQFIIAPLIHSLIFSLIQCGVSTQAVYPSG